MKQTQKYSQATQILTYPHTNQEQLYQELNRLGWYWNAKKKKWERDDTPAQEASKLIKIRIMASVQKVEQAAEIFIENAEDAGLKLLEKSELYPCRPPNQNDARIYLTFEDVEQ
ncbi:hypothetical protein CAL7716_107840 (plasmid) [Calothrix sp. PCC 7716]|nr:hypothetical protein CAL7716_107840 [Calothrix sp. PCC 7716]